MTTTVTAALQLRKGTAAQWTSANPVLLSGEMGYETDTGKQKIGNGVLSWTALTYYLDPATYEPADATILKQADVDDTPVNGVTTAPVSSNWAYDHAALVTAHGITTFGASLVDDADAGTARSTLGLGTAATTASTDYATASHNHSGTYEPADATLLKQSDVDDTPVDGATTAPVSSNWAYDHAALTTAHGTSTFGASLVDDADAGTARTTLGLGTAATTASTDYALASHNHTGIYLAAGADAADLTSSTATDGYVLTADGAGGAAWEEASGGGDAADLTSGTATDGYVLTADGAGGAAWEAIPAVDSTSLILLTALAFGAL